MSVAGKIVLITGAARGLGFEYARALGAQGARIVAGDVADCGDAVAAAGNGAIGVTLDVTDMASCEAMVAAAMTAFGRGGRAGEQRRLVWVAARRPVQPDPGNRLGRRDGG